MDDNFEKSLEIAKLVEETLQDKKAEDIRILDIHEVSVIADYFVIASGSNIPQLRAMADDVEKKLYEKGIPLHHSEGYQTATWILLDFGNILVHLFNKEDRSFYNIERVWGDAKELS